MTKWLKKVVGKFDGCIKFVVFWRAAFEITTPGGTFPRYATGCVKSEGCRQIPLVKQNSVNFHFIWDAKVEVYPRFGCWKSMKTTSCYIGLCIGWDKQHNGIMICLITKFREMKMQCWCRIRLLEKRSGWYYSQFRLTDLWLSTRHKVTVCW